MDTDKLLNQIKRMDKNKRSEVLDTLDNALSDAQKEKLVSMVKSKEIDGLISELIKSDEVQKKISELLG